MESQQKVEVEVNAKAADYRRILFWYHWKRLVLAGFLWLIIFPAFIWVLGLSSGVNPFSSENNSPLLILTVFGLLPVLVGFSVYFSIWRQAKKIERISEKAIFVFDENGLKTKSESSSSQMKWDRLAKICETKKDFIFFQQENIFYTVPKISFQNDEQIDDFKKLTREKLGEKAKLKN